MTIKASTMNIVRQKAQEGADWAALHEQLKGIAALDIEGEKKKVAKVQADRAKAENELKAAQQSHNAILLNYEAVVAEMRRLKAEAEGIITNATKRAEDMIAEARKAAAGEVQKWELSVTAQKQQLAQVQMFLAKADSDLDSKRKEHDELEKSHADLVRRHEQLRAGLAALTKDI